MSGLLERQLAASGARLRKASRTITHADLTEAANGASQAIELFPAPRDAVVVALWYRLTTQFTGGGAASVGMTIGYAGAQDAIATTFDLLGGTADGAARKPSLGVHAGPLATGEPILATLTPDAAHNLLGLSAGEVVVELVVASPDGNRNLEGHGP